jgi:hypothetical protein
MKLFTQIQQRQLRANGHANFEREDPEDFKPVVKLFCPWGGATWLLTELNPNSPDIAFGLCDLGMGFPELGNVSLTELESLTGPGGLRVERDRHFRAKKTLQAYTTEAQRHSRVVA